MGKRKRNVEASWSVQVRWLDDREDGLFDFWCPSLEEAVDIFHFVVYLLRDLGFVREDDPELWEFAEALVVGSLHEDYFEVLRSPDGVSIALAVV